ncbi:ABC transporter ATP-binding protein [bacterium]|nr:ABC transporter ATP-binding protein [bacterium]
MNNRRGPVLLKAENLDKSYFMDKKIELKVLKSINLEIFSGEILAIVGHSGAGKSTLLHMLGALDRPTQGRVWMEKTDLFSMDDAQLADFRNRYMGFVFQFHHLLAEFSALENVAIPGLMQGRSEKSVFGRAEQLLEEVGLSARLHHRPGELSGGEQQRVAFARALINDPRVILADEPSGNLDLANSNALHDLMWRLVKEKKRTFVVVTHNQELARQTDRIIELRDGCINRES